MRFQWSQLTKLENNRLIHSLKTAIAFLIGLLIVWVFHLPAHGQWLLISLLVVMCAQSRVGAVMQKSYMRFLGTLIGACIAVLTLYLAYPSVVWTTLILCLTTALFSYIADSPGYLSDAGPLGAVTVVIILIGQNPSYTTALDRFLEISLGILIALLVSRFIWPLHSRTQLRYIMKNTLQDLKILSEQLRAWGSIPKGFQDVVRRTRTNARSVLDVHEHVSTDVQQHHILKGEGYIPKGFHDVHQHHNVKGEGVSETEKTYETYEDKVISRFVSQNTLYNEVMRESFGRSNLTRVFKDILRGERDMLHYMNLMRNTLTHFSGETCRRFNQQIHVQKIYEVSQQLFESIINQLKDNKNKHTVESLYNFLDWKSEMQQELTPLVNNTADKLAVDLFIFAAEQLLTQLKKINSLIISV